MATGTINGKALAQCLKELQEHRDPDEYLLRKYPFYKIESYFKRINSIFGLEHYNVSYPLVTDVSSISSGQEFLTVKCHLEILDDEGKVVLVREGLASKELSFNDDGKEVNLKNLYRSTSQLAFKSAWDHLNIFGKAYEGMEEGDSTKTPAKPAASVANYPKTEEKPVAVPQTPTASTELNTYEVYTTSEIKIERQDRSGKPVYFLLGNLKDKTNVKVIFYPNQYGKDVQKMNALVANCEKANKRIFFKGSSSGHREGYLQIVFKGFN